MREVGNDAQERWAMMDDAQERWVTVHEMGSEAPKG